MAERRNDENNRASPTPLSEEALAALQQGLAPDNHGEDYKTLYENERYLKLDEAHKTLHALQHGTDERLKQFELRLKKVESSASTGARSPSVNSEASDLEDDHQLGYEENTIPEYISVNFELFKNRYGEKDGKNCIEVLIAGSDFDEQVRQELGRRGELDEKDHKRRVNYDEDDEVLIQRVRIQSPAILSLLCTTLDDPHANLEWKGQNRTTFYRPFVWFAYVQDKMKAELRKLEDHWSSKSAYLTEDTRGRPCKRPFFAYNSGNPCLRETQTKQPRSQTNQDSSLVRMMELRVPRISPLGGGPREAFSRKHLWQITTRFWNCVATRSL